MKRKSVKILVMGIITLIVLAFCGTGLGYIYYFVAPFRGQEFKSNYWRYPNHAKCDRARMVADVQEKFLQPGTHRNTVALNLGEPDCKLTKVRHIEEYTLGNCIPNEPWLKAMLAVLYDEKSQIIASRVKTYRILERIEYSSADPKKANNEELLEKALKQKGAWLVDKLGVRYALNKKNQLVIVSPNLRVSFAKYRDGAAGIRMPVEQCALW